MKYEKNSHAHKNAYFLGFQLNSKKLSHSLNYSQLVALFFMSNLSSNVVYQSQYYALSIGNLK